MTPLAAAANENLAQISNYLVYSSMAVYTLAFFAHIAEWTFGSRSKVARTAAALTGAEAASAPAVQVRGKGGATAVLDRPKVTTRSGAGTRDVPDGPGAAGGTVQGDLYGRIAVSLTALAFLVEAAGVVARAMSVERAPWGNMYEFSITFSTVAVGTYLALLAVKKNVRWMGLILVTTVLLDLGIAVTWLYTDSDQLVPALHSYWLWIHVSTAIFCGAVFYLGAAGAVLYLFRDSYEAKLAGGGKPGRIASSVLERLPSAASLDKFSYRINAAVFPLWTFTIIAGAIWAGDAWGRYWGWDPKEVWSFVTWVAYACYLHARATAGWKGRKAAYLALFAFACWIWNYYGVNILLSGKHSYAGV
ncbi:cytochrome C biogenesis protein [Streptomyces sp. WM6373]|uniref:c-type cytochrome biogenesis protein CcsB n=1 Tax=Streptomyces TaxID=1883 RepID=UPI0006B01E26|nr:MULTISPECIES: c-type cytochrome biogenesis protein CcsB [unclassified Streptomyces]KOU32954.1 cytochrome C biogenesis protein [Streptomyces sp. WM6373]KOU64689.1 cytochrome C biogenesis protein [Streptomyces sp. IGB124]KOU73545.1 cytochrome C biogenesis protein [Streptomyces sp. XY66]KOU83661.1 cytochrome C biogenesis protein [Streptomyces sp. XY58]KOV01589.1 cytochrome C biogenesis protein [Streptomyces sp. XY37]